MIVLVEAAFFGQRLNAWVFVGSAALLSDTVLATRKATSLPETK